MFVGHQAMHRHDAGMFELGGDRRLAQEPIPAESIAGKVVLDTFESDAAIQLGIDGDVDFAQAAAGMEAFDAVA
jgi:hypothetical protein